MTPRKYRNETEFIIQCHSAKKGPKNSLMLMIFPSVRKDHSSKRKKASKIEMYSIIPRFVLFVLLLYISKEREKLRLVNDFAGIWNMYQLAFRKSAKAVTENLKA